jgi:hypothetical protein
LWNNWPDIYGIRRSVKLIYACANARYLRKMT